MALSASGWRQSNKILKHVHNSENVSNPSLFRKEWHFRLTQSTLVCAQPEACAQVCCWTRNREGPSLWQVRYQSRVNPLPIPQCLENWEHSAANTYCSLSWRRPCHLELHPGAAVGPLCVMRSPKGLNCTAAICQCHGLENTLGYLLEEMQWLFCHYTCLWITHRNYGGIVLFFLLVGIRKTGHNRNAFLQ